ncbi:MAG: beta-lactamase family protein [Rikenellaceae bacterium]|nr:beta-lactamase family protein [Rikenellaceae bacterium]
MKLRTLLGIAALSLSLAALGCQKGDGGSAAPSKLEFAFPSLECDHLRPLPDLTIKTELTDGQRKALRWSSNHPDVIAVDERTGELTMHKRDGTIGTSVIITARTGDLTGQCYLHITSYLPRLDASIADFMERADVVGMSVAIVYKERLVYRRAYGHIDEARSVPARTDHMFRIASMSKPVTVIALLRLVEQGKLDIDRRVFGPGGVLGNDFGPVPAGSGKELITVRHLIEHTSGWAGDMAYTGYNDYPDADALVRAGLAGYDLYFTPGERYMYSNFGYAVLGRVVEKLSGQRYCDFVREQIIEPCGIGRMKLAKGPKADRDPDESDYFADNEQADMVHPAISRYFDSFGGWITTPTDYARFVVHTDRAGKVPDILPAEILNLTYFGGNWSHTGMLPGTATCVKRLTDDLTMIYMANTWRFFNDAFGEMYDCVSKPIIGQAAWPAFDLFEEADQ